MTNEDNKLTIPLADVPATNENSTDATTEAQSGSEVAPEVSPIEEPKEPEYEELHPNEAIERPRPFTFRERVSGMITTIH